MALFNKFFPSRKNTHCKHQDNVSEKIYAFNTDQVRIVLFRECDFRGRKLLFDSSAVKKLPLNNEEVQKEKYAEVSNGFGYLYTKPQSDFSQLAEMVFGAVAMSFRGTYFKIHCLSNPQRLMFTQVFPSPRHSAKNVSSRRCPRTSSQSLEHSIKLDDSGASSTTSISEQLSVHSTSSDTVLVCRRFHSTPLDVPNYNGGSVSNPSVVGDSGCGGQSYSSFGSEPNSLPFWESVTSHNAGTISNLSLSSGSLYKRILRSTSTSLDHSGSSLTGSTDECYTKPHHRTSKLGLALIVELTSGQEENLSQFLMEHIALLESMIWRTRHAVEVAYNRPPIFLSLMMDVADFSTQWLVNLLSGPLLANNLWRLLSNGCDNRTSISAFSNKINRSTSTSNLDSKSKENNGENSRGLYNSFSGFSLEKTSEFNIFNLSKFLRTEWDSLHCRRNDDCEDKNFTVERFLREFCEILEAIDVKDTNFFMSTLLTAVLTHHLGWVATCLPPSQEDSDFQSKFRNPYNSLWGQLSDLYGAIGHPIKMSQTIVTGSNKNDIITKILNSLTYFIRCTDIERKNITRLNVEEENKIVDSICKENACIPKEKRYEDHLKEIMTLKEKDTIPIKPSTAKLPLVKLTKSHTFLTKLSDMVEQAEECKDETVITDFEFKICNEEIKRKVNRLCRVPKSALEHQPAEVTALTPILKGSVKVESEKQWTSCDFSKKLRLESNTIEVVDCCSESVEENKVIFVLGDSDELVGIKKENSSSNLTEDCQKVKEFPGNGKSICKRPSFLDLNHLVSTKNDFQDSDFVKHEVDEAKIKPSTSWASLQLAQTSVKNGAEAPEMATNECSSVTLCLEKPFNRSQSVPPEESRKLEANSSKVKSKYKYSGVKFNLQQYPQIVKNYMKSKNLELVNLPLGEKSLKGSEGTAPSSLRFDFPDYESDFEEMEALQTPSNASELEFTSDLFTSDLPKVQHAKESNVVETPKAGFVVKKKLVPNTLVKELLASDVKAARKLSREETLKTEIIKGGPDGSPQKMNVVNLPMPKSILNKDTSQFVSYTSSVMKGIADNYIPDMVLQGVKVAKNEWDYKLKHDLALTSQHSPLDQPVDEAVAIVANTDTWEVQLVSSHTYVIDKGTSGIRVGMSQLVANMLESLLHMWKLQVPPQYCLMHIEQKLQELCIRSKALAQLLLATEFCSMELLTSTLHLEVNDVPLLMAVASTHTPQVTQKYGLSFQ